MRVISTLVLLLVTALGAAGCSSAGAPRDVQAQALVAESKATILVQTARATDSAAAFRATLRDARGVLIFPSVFQAAVGIGGSGGSGVMLVRDAQGTWSYPAFFRLTSGSLGIQLGAQSSEVIFLLMSDSAVNAVISSPGKIGLDAAATLGQLGGGASTATSTGKVSNVIGYSKGSGLFAGAAVAGSYVGPMNDFNWAYYGNDTLTARDILLDRKASNPDADSLRQALIVGD